MFDYKYNNEAIMRNTSKTGSNEAVFDIKTFYRKKKNIGHLRQGGKVHVYLYNRYVHLALLL
jgi:hypothetical protein